MKRVTRIRKALNHAWEVIKACWWLSPCVVVGGGAGVALWSFIVTGDTKTGVWALNAALWALIVVIQNRTIDKSSPAHEQMGRIITDSYAPLIIVDMEDRNETHRLYRFVDRTNAEEEDHER